MAGGLKESACHGYLAIVKAQKSVDVIVQECAEIGIEALTLYTFSTENWKRSDSEISGLMNLLHAYLDKKYKKMQSNGIKLNAIGRLDELPER